MERHRTSGTGPRYIALGRAIRYRRRDLHAWITRLHSAARPASRRRDRGGNCRRARRKRVGRWWSCRCPAHDQPQPVAVTARRRPRRLIVRCWAGCDPRDVRAKLRRRGLMGDGDSWRRPPMPTWKQTRPGIEPAGSRGAAHLGYHQRRTRKPSGRYSPAAASLSLCLVAAVHARASPPGRHCGQAMVAPRQ